jgi:hypothetical protein
VLSSSLARAEAPARNAVSYEPFAWLSRGLVLQYERLIAPRVSVLGGVGARFGARDDFSSETWLVKAEGRYWLTRDRGMTGPYLGVASAAARTHVTNRRQNRSLGAMWDVEESARFGWRFVAFGFQELTPSSGLVVVHEIDERGILAPTTGVTVGFNLTIGWMF